LSSIVPNCDDTGRSDSGDGGVSDGCDNCGHAIGYHHSWVNSDEEMFCTAGDSRNAGGECICAGYRDEGYITPQTGPYSRALELKAK
jgi:hypothetical protein